MTFVAEPKAESDLNSFGVGVIENGLGVFIDAPGSDGISSVAFEQFQTSAAANAVNLEGFSVDQQGGFFALLLNGHFCSQKWKGKQEREGDFGKDSHSKVHKIA